MMSSATRWCWKAGQSLDACQSNIHPACVLHIMSGPPKGGSGPTLRGDALWGGGLACEASVKEENVDMDFCWTSSPMEDSSLAGTWKSTSKSSAAKCLLSFWNKRCFYKPVLDRSVSFLHHFPLSAVVYTRINQHPPFFLALMPSTFSDQVSGLSSWKKKKKLEFF